MRVYPLGYLADVCEVCIPWSHTPNIKLPEARTSYCYMFRKTVAEEVVVVILFLFYHFQLFQKLISSDKVSPYWFPLNGTLDDVVRRKVVSESRWSLYQGAAPHTT